MGKSSGAYLALVLDLVAKRDFILFAHLGLLNDLDGHLLASGLLDDFADDPERALSELLLELIDFFDIVRAVAGLPHLLILISVVRSSSRLLSSSRSSFCSLPSSPQARSHSPSSSPVHSTPQAQLAYSLLPCTHDASYGRGTKRIDGGHEPRHAAGARFHGRRAASSSSVGASQIPSSTTFLVECRR